MDSVKLSMEGLKLPSSRFGNPVAYTFMYVQWEANRVIKSSFPSYSPDSSNSSNCFVSVRQPIGLHIHVRLVASQ